LSKRIIALLVGIATLAVLVAGCGGGGGDSTSGETLTKAEFIKQGDEICKKGNTALEAEANEFAEENGINTEKPTEAQEEEVVEQVVGPAYLSQAEEVGQLGAPSGEEAKVEAMLEALTEGAEVMEANPKALVEEKNPLEKAAKLAQEFGFKVCGSA
jgi:uncharacterized protein YfcZ (UPF0381/DUF406 family)